MLPEPGPRRRLSTRHRAALATFARDSYGHGVDGWTVTALERLRLLEPADRLGHWRPTAAGHRLLTETDVKIETEETDR